MMYPDEVKELFSIISNGLMNKLDYLEENGLLSLNNDTSLPLKLAVMILIII